MSIYVSLEIFSLLDNVIHSSILKSFKKIMKLLSKQGTQIHQIIKYSNKIYCIVMQDSAWPRKLVHHFEQAMIPIYIYKNFKSNIYIILDA